MGGAALRWRGRRRVVEAMPQMRDVEMDGCNGRRCPWCGVVRGACVVLLAALRQQLASPGARAGGAAQPPSSDGGARPVMHLPFPLLYTTSDLRHSEPSPSLALLRLLCLVRLQAEGLCRRLQLPVPGQQEGRGRGGAVHGQRQEAPQVGARVRMCLHACGPVCMFTCACVRPCVFWVRGWGAKRRRPRGRGGSGGRPCTHTRAMTLALPSSVAFC